MEYLLIIIVILLFLAVTIGLIHITLFSVTEEIYMHVFQKPIYASSDRVPKMQDASVNENSFTCEICDRG